jgi:hypothetical protein
MPLLCIRCYERKVSKSKPELKILAKLSRRIEMFKDVLNFILKSTFIYLLHVKFLKSQKAVEVTFIERTQELKRLKNVRDIKNRSISSLLASCISCVKILLRHPKEVLFFP